MDEKAKDSLKQVEGMIKTADAVMEKLKNRPTMQSDLLFWQGLRSTYSRIYNAATSGKPLVFSGMFTPTELYFAMDIAPLFPENHSVLMASQQEACYKYLEWGEGYGMTKEACAPHRVAIGLASHGLLPRPDFVVSTATTCDSTLKAFEVLGTLYGCPTYMVDSPYEFSPSALEYQKGEVKRLIEFLEERTGRKLDYDRLREVLKLSKEAYDYWEGISQLKKAYPAPLGGRDAVKEFGSMLTGAGTQETAQFFKARYHEVKERVEKGQGVVPGGEKVRIAWLYVLPLFDLGISDWLEQQHKAVIVVDSFGYASPDVELNPEDPLDYLAKKPLKWGFVRLTYGPMNTTNFAEEMANWCMEYKVDCAIVLAHWSCKQYCGTIKALKDQVMGEKGIPFLILDGDLLDGRVVSSAQMKAKLDEFLQMLQSQKGRGRKPF